MLEKVAGVALVTKLRAILLKEGDFNFRNRLIFGKRMLALTRKNGLVPEEIYSEKGRTAEDGVLHQVLAYDIARQKRAPLIVASVDAAQCYDRIAHAVAALTLRASRVPESSVRCMLQPIRDMEFYTSGRYLESQKRLQEEQPTRSKAHVKATRPRQLLGSRLARSCHESTREQGMVSP